MTNNPVVYCCFAGEEGAKAPANIAALEAQIAILTKEVEELRPYKPAFFDVRKRACDLEKDYIAARAEADKLRAELSNARSGVEMLTKENSELRQGLTYKSIKIAYPYMAVTLENLRAERDEYRDALNHRIEDCAKLTQELDECRKKLFNLTLPE